MPHCLNQPLRGLLSASCAVFAVMCLSACAGGRAATTDSPAEPLPTIVLEVITRAATPVPDTASAPAAAATLPASEPVATRVGAEYVLRLPRETILPPAWAMDRAPAYQVREPAPDESYRFACRDLPARSIGLATVGYRSLEGLPSIAVEYVIYPSTDAAAAALIDMRNAVNDCASFTIGDGDSATAAVLRMLDYPQVGATGFAAALETSGPISGELVTHLLKFQQANVVVGIHHSVTPEEAPPDEALTVLFAETALRNLGE